MYTGYEALAAAEGFIVVHPTGVPSPGTDANSSELVDGQDPGRDDIAFANALIDTLIDEWCADPAGSTRPACRTADLHRPAAV